VVWLLAAHPNEGQECRAYWLFPPHALESGVVELQKTLAGRADAFDRIELKSDGNTVRFEVKLGEETSTHSDRQKVDFLLGLPPRSP
jgi:hypothetical protein